MAVIQLTSARIHHHHHKIVRVSGNSNKDGFVASIAEQPKKRPPTFSLKLVAPPPPPPSLHLPSLFFHPSYSRHHHRHNASASAAEALSESSDAEDGSQPEGSEEEEEPTEQPPPSASPTSATERIGRLYVGNLPYSMTASQLSDIFREAGQVDTVEVIYDRMTDRSRGFAFVVMGSVQEAQEAIRMFDGSQVGGRTVRVNFPEVPKGGEKEVVGPRTRGGGYRGFVDSPHKVYAGNLGWGVNSQALKDAFAAQRGLLGAKVLFERDSGRSRGYGFVSFETAEDAQSAMEAMNGVELEGRPLRLNPAGERLATRSA
ncbi:hypothetical protein QJS10_CPA08g00025 [Acorus calamus]|uniref:RRM domain-containing protein n=1 Tax=Acorus calamus TaxID=4465 RepID=A0AAV9EDC0_ACOCL|nr:hypothetical protein QJS10_CPA08g00025 [Acorus calamus]